MSNAGCPPKYTPERLQAILDSIADRIPYEIAAEANGIDESTLYDWIRTGKAHRKEGIESVLSKFSQDIKQIEQNKIRHHLRKIEANVERWQSDAWILERRWYKYFGPNVQLKEMDERMKYMEELFKQKGDDSGKEIGEEREERRKERGKETEEA